MVKFKCSGPQLSPHRKQTPSPLSALAVQNVPWGLGPHKAQEARIEGEPGPWREVGKARVEILNACPHLCKGYLSAPSYQFPSLFGEHFASNKLEFNEESTNPIKAIVHSSPSL